MKKRKSIVLALIVFISVSAMLLSSCGSKSAKGKFLGTEGEPVVAVVDDVEIAADFLSAFAVLSGLNQGLDMTLDEIKSSPELVEMIEQNILYELADYIRLEKYYTDKGEDLFGDDYKMNLAGFLGGIRSQAKSNEEFNRILTDGNITDEVLTRYFKNSVVSRRLYEEALLSVTDENVETYYAEQVALGEDSIYFSSEPMVFASHILAESEEKCREAYNKIKDGADFESLASEYGTDGTKERGGKLGAYVYGDLVKEFSEVVFSLEIGTVSEPFQTQFGWHIAKVDGKIGASEIIPLSWVKDRIKEELIGIEYNNKLEEYTQSYKAEFFYPPEGASGGEEAESENVSEPSGETPVEDSGESGSGEGE